MIVFGNREEFIDRNAGTTEYKYNAVGELYEQTDARGNVTVSEYDNLGRVKSIDRQAANEGLSTYEYYPYGNNGVNQVSKLPIIMV